MLPLSYLAFSFRAINLGDILYLTLGLRSLAVSANYLGNVRPKC